MKIMGKDDPLLGGYPEKTAKHHSGPQADFGKILKEKIESTTAAHTGIQTPTFIDTVATIRIPAVSALEKLPAIDSLENLLDLLDAYRHKLADPTLNLRDIYPLISEIESEKGRLTPMLDSLTRSNGCGH